ncbi:hypothetical protein JCM11491_005658 [Sporobolomyces phaffii]
MRISMTKHDLDGHRLYAHVKAECYRMAKQNFDTFIACFGDIFNKREDLDSWCRNYIATIDNAILSEPAYPFVEPNFSVAISGPRQVWAAVKQGESTDSIMSRFSDRWIQDNVTGKLVTPYVGRRHSLLELVQKLLDRVSRAQPSELETVTGWANELKRTLRDPSNQAVIEDPWEYMKMYLTILDVTSRKTCYTSGGKMHKELALPTLFPSLFTPPSRRRDQLRTALGLGPHQTTAQSLGRSFVISRRQAHFYQLRVVS